MPSARKAAGYYDRFRGRLMFPIHNESGKVIGFGGRALRPGEEPKYLNSPETALYRKSYVLYNLHRAKDAMRKSDYSVLVEGYMDVIGVYSAGVHNVVASCGTSLTNTQVRALKRHSERIVVNFDPDTAGANAAEKSFKMLLDEGLRVRVLELGGDLDPDEYVKASGADAYRQRLEKAPAYFHWLADRARQKFDMRTVEGRMDAFKFLAPRYPEHCRPSGALCRRQRRGRLPGRGRKAGARPFQQGRRGASAQRPRRPQMPPPSGCCCIRYSPVRRPERR